MNTEYLWWLLALLLAAGGVVAFLALGQVTEIEDVPGETTGSGSAELAAPGSGQPRGSPQGTAARSPDAPPSTNEAP